MRVAVVGLGAVGTRAARQLASTAEVESVVVADPKPDRMSEVVASLGAKAESHALGGGLPNADVVLVATPVGTQADRMRAGTTRRRRAKDLKARRIADNIELSPFVKRRGNLGRVIVSGHEVNLSRAIG